MCAFCLFSCDFPYSKLFHFMHATSQSTNLANRSCVLSCSKWILEAQNRSKLQTAVAPTLKTETADCKDNKRWLLKGSYLIQYATCFQYTWYAVFSDWPRINETRKNEQFLLDVVLLVEFYFYFFK